MHGDVVIRRQAIATLRGRQTAGHTLTATEQGLLAQLADTANEIPVGLVVECSIEDPIGRVFIERPRPANPKRVADLQGSLFDREAA